MTPIALIAYTVLAFAAGALLGFFVLLLRSTRVTGRRLRALRRRLLGPAWRPVVLTPMELPAQALRDTRSTLPSNATH